MGNFRGHAIPGTGFLIMGGIILLRSLDIPFLRRLRFKKKMIFAEAFMKIFGGILGILLEGGDMVYHEAYKSESHWDHLRILTLLTFVGFVDLLHLRMVLKESFWATITPMAFAFIGYMFNQHGQETQARTVAHNINAYILYAAAMSRFIEILIAIHTTPEKKKQFSSPKRRNSSELPLKSDTSIADTVSPNNHSKFSLWSILPTSFFSRRSKNEPLQLNPIYTNPHVFSTIFPMVTAFLMIIEGIWWWWMGVVFFLHPSSHDEQGMDMGNSSMKMDHGSMMVTAAFYKVFVATLVSLIAANLLLQVIDRWIGRRRRYSPLSNEENGFYNGDPMEDDSKIIAEEMREARSTS